MTEQVIEEIMKGLAGAEPSTVAIMCQGGHIIKFDFVPGKYTVKDGCFNVPLNPGQARIDIEAIVAIETTPAQPMSQKTPKPGKNGLIPIDEVYNPKQS